MKTILFLLVLFPLFSCSKDSSPKKTTYYTLFFNGQYVACETLCVVGTPSLTNCVGVNGMKFKKILNPVNIVPIEIPEVN